MYNRPRIFDEAPGGIPRRLSGQIEKPELAGYLDLDHFKKVNDTTAHDPRRQVLRQIGRAACRIFTRLPNDVLARLGGEGVCILSAQHYRAATSYNLVRSHSPGCLRLNNPPWQCHAEVTVSAGLARSVEWASKVVRNSNRRAEQAAFTKPSARAANRVLRRLIQRHLITLLPAAVRSSTTWRKLQPAQECETLIFEKRARTAFFQQALDLSRIELMGAVPAAGGACAAVVPCGVGRLADRIAHRLRRR